MRKQSINLFKTLSEEQAENLMTVVEETLAVNYREEKSKIFTVADLWNIQRQGKKTVQRRYSL